MVKAPQFAKSGQTPFGGRGGRDRRDGRDHEVCLTVHPRPFGPFGPFRPFRPFERVYRVNGG
jgi:hypothetical protein